MSTGVSATAAHAADMAWHGRLRHAAGAVAAAAFLMSAAVRPAVAAVPTCQLADHQQTAQHAGATAGLADHIRRQRVLSAPTVHHSGSGASVGSHSPNPIAQLAGLFGGSDLDEPVDPFTLYGTAFKRFVIDKLDGEKVWHQ